MTKIPIYREDDDKLMGFINQDTAGWTAQTVFGYVFLRSTERRAVEDEVLRNGLSVLDGVWQYFDKTEGSWYPCKLKEVYEGRVVVIRTNEMGYEYPDGYKRVTIINPTETNLIKS